MCTEELKYATSVVTQQISSSKNVYLLDAFHITTEIQICAHTKIFLTYQSDILEFVMITAFIAVTIEKCRYFHQELENFLSWTTDKAFYLSVIQSCTDLSADKLCYR